MDRSESETVAQLEIEALALFRARRSGRLERHVIALQLALCQDRKRALRSLGVFDR